MAVSETAVKPETIVRERKTGAWARFMGAHSTKVLLLVEVVVILVAWQWVSGVSRIINPIYLPPPSQLVAGAAELIETGEIFRHIPPSVTAWTVGLVLALVVAVPLGLLLGRVYVIHRLAGPFIWSLYATPWLAYQPLSKVWFGFGLAPVIFLVFIAALFPTLLNTAAGVGTTKPSLISAARVFGASRFDEIRKVVLPSSVPLMLAGMRQSVAMATIALIVAEMNGPSLGVGTMIITKAQSRMIDQAFAGILVAVAWTLAMTYLIKWIGQRIAPWQRDARSE